MDDLGTLDPESFKRRDNRKKLSSKRSLMRFGMCCVEAVLGAYCYMSSRDGLQLILISGDGNAMGRGSVCIMRCDVRFVSQLAGSLNKAAAIIDCQSIKTSPERFDARGYDGAKNLGIKRHLLVGTQGLVISAKMLAADITNRVWRQVAPCPSGWKRASPPADLG